MLCAGLIRLTAAGMARASSALASGAGGARGRFTAAPGIRPPAGAAPRGLAAGRVPGAAWQRPGRGGEAKALAKGAPGRPVSAAAGAITETAAWHPWYMNNDKGRIPTGYATRYSVNGVPGQDFTFITIRLAGHMVPTFRPPAALALFERWLAGGTF